MKAAAMKRCAACGRESQVLSRSKRCAECRWTHQSSDALVGGGRYADDPAAQMAIRIFPDGMTHEVVGELMGVTRARVGQIEADALRSMALRVRVAGISAQDVADMLAGKADRERANQRWHAEAEVTSIGRPRDNQPLPVEGYSEHAARVEAALVELEERAARVEFLSRDVADASDEERAA